jgi:recombination protein RecA
MAKEIETKILAKLGVGEAGKAAAAAAAAETPNVESIQGKLAARKASGS